MLERFHAWMIVGELGLSDIVREGAQLMLQYALELEVTEALGRGYYENAPGKSPDGGRYSETARSRQEKERARRRAVEQMLLRYGVLEEWSDVSSN